MNGVLVRTLALTILCVAIQPALGQVWFVWSPTTGDNWDEDDNWTSPYGPVVPNAGDFEGEAARIPNIATTAVINSTVPKVAQVDHLGSLTIQSGGTLETIQNGSATGGVVISSGVLSVEGNGKLIVDTLLYNRNVGNLRIAGPAASVQVNSFFYSWSTITAALMSDSAHGTIHVAGDAMLDGTLHVENGHGFGKTYGSEWVLVSADRIIGGFDTIQSDEALDRGLQYRVSTSGGEAKLSVANNLILTVNLNEGTLGIENAVGGTINLTGYTVTSNEGLLVPSAWNSLAASSSDWSHANPNSSAISELSLENARPIAVGTSLDLGSAYGNLPTALSDVAFTYTNINGEHVEGIVEYVGSVELEMFVDPSTGEVAIGSASKFKDIEITAYSLSSPSGDLVPGSWNSLAESGEAGAGWGEANPTPNALSELNLENSTRFLGKSGFSLGNAFQVNGERDLVFHYTTLAGELVQGEVVYGAIPTFETPDLIVGDYNNNGVVDAADYVIWRKALATNDLAADGNGDLMVDGADYGIWRSKFGTSISGGLGGNDIAIPEPNTGLSVATLVLLGLLTRRRYH